MLVGRIIFSLGGENINVAQNTLVTKWFIGKELSFAMGLNISISRMGSAAAGFFYPPLYNVNHNLFLPLFFGTIICIVSWLLCNCMIYMDRKAGKK